MLSLAICDVLYNAAIEAYRSHQYHCYQRSSRCISFLDHGPKPLPNATSIFERHRGPMTHWVEDLTIEIVPLNGFKGRKKSRRLSGDITMDGTTDLNLICNFETASSFCDRDLAFCCWREIPNIIAESRMLGYFNSCERHDNVYFGAIIGQV